MSRFDLETSMAAWRRSLENRDVILPEDLDELERHIRDQVDELRRSGRSERDAFTEAIGMMGDPSHTESAFREVYWPKLRRKGMLQHRVLSQGVLLRGYLKAAVRSLLRRKGYSAVNVFGLAVGLACALLLFQYVTYQQSYDDFHADADRIYRVRHDVFRGSEPLFQVATTYPAVGPTMAATFPDVEVFTRMYMFYGGGVIRVGDRIFNEDLIFAADSTFFSVFSYPLVHGNPEELLTEPMTAVISTEMATKYFGDANPVGRDFTFANDRVYEIVGVAESPEQSHFKFNFLLTFDDDVFAANFERDAWNWYDFYTYLKLRPGTDPDALEAQFPPVIAQHKSEQDAANEIFSLQPLTDIHLHSDLLQEARTNGSATSIYFLTVIAALILLIAWVNYVNLATARATERAREIGVRKAVGAHRRDLIRQFILESALINGAACLLAVVLSLAAMPLFGRLTGTSESMGLILDAGFWGFLAASLLLGSLCAGLYPAFVLSSFKPSSVLRGRFSTGRRGLLLRKGLVLVQFAASVGLISGTIIVYQQIDYMRSRDLGIDIDQTLVIDGPDVVPDDSVHALRIKSFRDELLQFSGVQKVTGTTEIPGNLIYWTTSARRLQDAPEDNFSIYRIGIDDQFLETFGHRLIAGRSFEEERATDRERIIISEEAVRSLGLADPDQAVGAMLHMGRDTVEVLGVVENYHHEGLQKGFYPIAFHYHPREDRYFAVRFDPSQTASVIETAERTFKASFPGNPFSYVFLDDHFARQYRSNRQFAGVFGFFALLAIFVAALGLSGLAGFTASQRSKEIGIRKVLGSRVSNILLLLAKDYLRLVVLAGFAAVPVIWWIMSRWLERFAFRLDIQPWPFVVALAAVLFIALATVSLQSLRVATMDPVKTLRAE